MADATGEVLFNRGGLVVAIRRRWKLVLACCLIAPGVALLITQAQQREYSATAVLLFRDPAIDQQLVGGSFVPSSSDPARDAETNVKLVALSTVAAHTAQRIGGDVSATSVARNVDVARNGDQSALVNITATSTKPALAAQIANTFAREYIAFRAETDRARILNAANVVRREIAALPNDRRNAIRRSVLLTKLSDLRSLAPVQNGNAELVQRAGTPSSPSSPKPAQNLLLGLLLGIFLGGSLALLRETHDRRLRDSEEVTDVLDTPVLTTVPTSEAILQARSLQDDAALPPAEAEAFRMLRTTLRYFHKGHGTIKSVLVTSALSGEGKTTVAHNLAVAAAEAGESVVLIDADLRHPSLAAALRANPSPGLAEFLRGETSEGVIRRVPLPAPVNSATPRTLDVITAGTHSANPCDLLDSPQMKGIIRELEGRYDLVVLDVPPTAIVSDAVPLVSRVSGVIVVARLSKSTREATANLAEQLGRLDAPLLGVVINCLSRGDSRYGYRYDYGYHYHQSGVPGLNGQPIPSRAPAAPAPVAPAQVPLGQAGSASGESSLSAGGK
jgi:capsular exopolysaccharide synthesis family protein